MNGICAQSLMMNGKLCEYDIKDKHFKNITIQFYNTVFYGSEFYDKDRSLEDFLGIF